ncbi:MAG: hypothetical protein DAHOPDDO_00067 [Ignavibacteriaceae bacterium]|nr:hypothetical protein [Ignavibacteriaceae bacterium]
MRDTSYSTTQKLIKELGIEEVEKAWIGKGMNAWQELSEKMDEYVSPYVLRYMSNKFDWKRPVNPKSAIYVGVQRGTVPASYYKHLIFPEEMRSEKQFE